MHFEVRVLKPPLAGVTLLTLEAANETDARNEAQGRGYTVLRVRARRRSLFGPRAFPLVLFSQELVALIEAGLPLVDALQTLGEKHREPETQPVLARLLGELYQGRPLSRALESCPGAFPPLYVETVRASERTGDLPGALQRFVSYEMQMQTVRATLVTASIYPALLIAVGGLVTLFLVGYVVPKFSAIYADLGREQPLPSQLLMLFGRFIGEHGIALTALAVAAVAGLVSALSRPELRGRLLAQLERLPGLGERMRVFQLARFYRTAGMLLRGGVPAVTALVMVGGLLDARTRARLDEAVREVREGKPLSQVMEARGLTTPIASRLLRVGERTGDMGGMMDRIASFHDAEIAQWVTHFTRLFEPLLMVVIGLVIGFIVLALYMPIFDLAGSLQ